MVCICQRQFREIARIMCTWLIYSWVCDMMRSVIALQATLNFARIIYTRKKVVNMSSILPRHKEILEDLFEMRDGYLLRFTNDTFRWFMILNANIDVYCARIC